VGSRKCLFALCRLVLYQPDNLTHLNVQIMRVPPENFRLIADLLEKETKGKGRVESMGYAVVNREERIE
jgi:hypothetical protein